MYITLLTIVFAGIAYREARFIRKHGVKPALLPFTVILVLAFLYNITTIVYRELPSPNAWIKAVFAPLQAWIV
ncbi:hypothetical protein ACFFSY_18665 [Paenibacillus aurantiacus]|uniref:Uncharacterized protein n=1 Tax=Paenibacillus aurantiacus TaxID=1936118 RepID=A0ABV5KRU1_9BACL